MIEANETYNKYEANISNYFINIQEIVKDIGFYINVDNEKIFTNAKLLAQLDPNKENREKNLCMIKKGGELVFTLGATAYAGPFADAAIISAYALSQMFFGDSEAVKIAFSKVLTKNNLSEKEKMYISEAKQITRANSRTIL